MKKLIKSGVCGTRKQCIYALFTKDLSTVAAEKKKTQMQHLNVLFPTHTRFMAICWLFTLIVRLSWTSWPLYGIRAYVIPHVTQKKQKQKTLCHWAIEDHIMSKILFSFLHITYTKKVMIQIQKFCLDVMQPINLSKLWIILNR